MTAFWALAHNWRLFIDFDVFQTAVYRRKMKGLRKEDVRRKKMSGLSKPSYQSFFQVWGHYEPKRTDGSNLKVEIFWDLLRRQLLREKPLLRIVEKNWAKTLITFDPKGRLKWNFGIRWRSPGNWCAQGVVWFWLLGQDWWPFIFFAPKMAWKMSIGGRNLLLFTTFEGVWLLAWFFGNFKWTIVPIIPARFGGNVNLTAWVLVIAFFCGDFSQNVRVNSKLPYLSKQ